MFGNEKLLQNEEEFLKINTEIDSRTKDLMEQLSRVMKQQAEDQEIMNSKWETNKSGGGKSSTDSQMQVDAVPERFIKIHDQGSGSDCNGTMDEYNSELTVFGDGIPEYKKANRNSKLCHSAVPRTANASFPGRLTRHKSETRLKDKALDLALPDTLKGMGNENIIRFLKAKVKVLTEQLDVMHVEEKKHVDRIKELQGDRERVAEDRDKWIQQANMAKNVLVKHEQHASNIVVQLQNIQAENGHLKREVEKLKKELKQITQNSSSNEVRLNRSVEEVEKLKISLRQAKQDEKDLREAHRKKTEELSGAVKRLDKQRIELLHAFKKQLVIIDNLKKQKGLIEAGKFVKSMEEDFMEFLDWNPEKD